jgi:hypothetical protein
MSTISGRRRRHEVGVARPGAADPILARPKLPGPLLGTAPTGEQRAVNLAPQAPRERKAVAQAGEAMFEGGHVA